MEAGERLRECDIERCMYSLGDNTAFLVQSRAPVDEMITLLLDNFHPTDPSAKGGVSLSILAGRGGARLSHRHAKQFSYVLQSLTLWRDIQHNMFKLWCLAEQVSPSFTWGENELGKGRGGGDKGNSRERGEGRE